MGDGHLVEHTENVEPQTPTQRNRALGEFYEGSRAFFARRPAKDLRPEAEKPSASTDASSRFAKGFNAETRSNLSRKFDLFIQPSIASKGMKDFMSTSFNADFIFGVAEEYVPEWIDSVVFEGEGVFTTDIEKMKRIERYFYKKLSEKQEQIPENPEPDADGWITAKSPTLVAWPDHFKKTFDEDIVPAA